MALYDDSLETSVTSAKRHNSAYKVDFMRKLASLPAGVLLLRRSKFRAATSKACKKLLCLSQSVSRPLPKTGYGRLIEVYRARETVLRRFMPIVIARTSPQSAFSAFYQHEEQRGRT